MCESVEESLRKKSNKHCPRPGKRDLWESLRGRGVYLKQNQPLFFPMFAERADYSLLHTQMCVARGEIINGLLPAVDSRNSF